MHPPDEITRILHARFERDYPDWARGRGTWPLRVALRPPTTEQRSADPLRCHAWADEWARYDNKGTLEYSNLRFPTGTHRMPGTLVLATPTEVAAMHEDTVATWRACGRRLTNVEQSFPRARFDRIVRRITELPESDFTRLVNTVTWLRENPTSGMLLRQLPIEGIDTKWLQRHARLVLTLLDTDPADDTPGLPATGDDVPVSDVPVSQRIQLHQRLGLRVPPDLVQVAVLCPALRQQFAGMRHFAAGVDDLDHWQEHPTTVAVLENKETGYAITEDHPGTVVLHGQGFSVAHYARIRWVHTARIIYWGDIDIPGLQFVNDLRAYGIVVHTVLMNKEILRRFGHLTVDGSGPQRISLPHLTATERVLYEQLLQHAEHRGTGLLLEQERIPWDYARTQLCAALRDRVGATDLPDSAQRCQHTVNCRESGWCTE